MDTRAWPATVHTVSKSPVRLSNCAHARARARAHTHVYFHGINRNLGGWESRITCGLSGAAQGRRLTTASKNHLEMRDGRLQRQTYILHTVTLLKYHSKSLPWSASLTKLFNAYHTIFSFSFCPFFSWFCLEVLSKCEWADAEKIPGKLSKGI